MKKILKNILNLVLLSVLLFLAPGCGEGVTEPYPNVFKKERLIQLQTAADQVITKYKTPGLIAYISVPDEGELTITRGVSNMVTNEPMNVENYFRVGSITKSVIGEAVLILWDEGKVDLNKTISYYLPELKIPNGEKITIRMLGNMRSGLFNYTEDVKLITDFYENKGEKVFTQDEIINIICINPVRFAPGTKYEYNNSNYYLLGLLIKKITGKLAADFLNEKIFQPLGMNHTFWPQSRFLPSPYTHGYSDQTGTLTDVTNWDASIYGAAGALISNIHDLRIWIGEMIDGSLLSTNARVERFYWSTAANGNFYGFGLMKNAGWIGHVGTLEGYNTMLFYNPENKITIIINTNSSNDSPAESVFNDFTYILSN